VGLRKKKCQRTGDLQISSAHKEDKLQCKNYRFVPLLNVIYVTKFREIFNIQYSVMPKKGDNRCGFREGRSATDYLRYDVFLKNIYKQSIFALIIY